MTEKVRFAHVGDLHVKNSRQDIRTVVDTITSIVPKLDFVITGGDNTESGADGEYETFAGALSELKAPLYIVRGNHDRGQFGTYMERYLPSKRSECSETGSKNLAMYLWNGVYWEQHFSTGLTLPKPEPSHYPFYSSAQGNIVVLRDQRQFAYSFKEKGWKFIVLDASPWILNPDQLQWFTRELDENPSIPTLVFIHHTLLPCGIKFDAAPLWDRWEVLETLSRHPQVKGVFQAHVHMNRIWNYNGLKLIITGYRNVRQVSLGSDRIESVSPLESYENDGHGQDFENRYFFISERFGRMFRVHDTNLWHFADGGSGDPDTGFAWAEENCPEDLGLEWKFYVPQRDIGSPYTIQANFAFSGKWIFQLLDRNNTVLLEKKGQGVGEYRMDEIETTFGKEGIYVVRLLQPGGQERVEGRAAYFAFASPKSVQVSNLHMREPGSHFHDKKDGSRNDKT